jgi:hypothetical protein
VEGKKAEPEPLLYEPAGLVAALLEKGQRLDCGPVGEGGLGGWTVRERNADMADEWCGLVDSSSPAEDE